MKFFYSRGSLIGDTVMSLPGLTILHQKYPGCKITFTIAKKCQQAAPLFSNHPLISEIYITNEHEGLNSIDKEFIKNGGFDLAFNPFPQHPKEQDWYNHRNCCEETLLMADEALYLEYLKLNDFDKIPNLFKTSPDIVKLRAIAIFPFAGYGRAIERSPSAKYWESLIEQIPTTYNIYHFGAENEPTLSNSSRYHKLTDGKFSDQILASLSCQVVIGTDSGSMWAVAAYNLVPSINLITNHLSGHVQNKLALAPLGELSHNLYADGGCDNILQKDVINLLETLL